MELEGELGSRVASCPGSHQAKARDLILQLAVIEHLSISMALIDMWNHHGYIHNSTCSGINMTNNPPRSALVALLEMESLGYSCESQDNPKRGVQETRQK